MPSPKGKITDSCSFIDDCGSFLTVLIACATLTVVEVFYIPELLLSGERCGGCCAAGSGNA